MEKITLLVLLTIVGIFRVSQMVYADSSILSVLPASLNSTVGIVFNVSVQIDPASNNVCVVKGTLNFDNLSCQDITIADSSVIAMITPTCANPSFVLGIPKCTTTVQSILSVSAKGIQAGQGNLSLTEVNVIGAGIDVPFSAEEGVYNIIAVSIAAPKTIQQDAGQEEQITIPQQEESVVAPVISIIPGSVAPASLLTIMINILSFGTDKDWLAVAVTISIILILAVFYFIIKKSKIMKKNIYIIIGMGIIVVIGSWLLLSYGFWQDSVKETNVVQEIAEKEVVLVIDNGGGNPNTFITEFKEGMTAFDLLKKEAEKLALALKTKNYDIGIFIEAIGEKENGQDGKYWLYYINGEMPMVAADKMIIKPGDKVEFKFEKSPF